MTAAGAPDVVGTAEVAVILGVEVSRVWRYRQEGRLPEPAADNDASPVWHRTDIEALTMPLPAAPENGTPLPGSGPLSVFGLSEAAVYLGADKSQIGRWRRKGQFPEPCLEKRAPGVPWTPGAGLSSGPLWYKRDLSPFKRKLANQRRKRQAAKAAKAAASAA